MTYEIGQKVETPFGVGKVLYVFDIIYNNEKPKWDKLKEELK